jgi:large subunit ribosomal protein L4e
MTSRPTVTIATAEGKASGETHPLPAVFKAPIRPDIVQYAYLEATIIQWLTLI